MSRNQTTVRKRITRRRHVDLTPTMRDTQICDYNQELYLAHRRSELHYQTGPRYGQQLADLRRARGRHA